MTLNVIEGRFPIASLRTVSAAFCCSAEVSTHKCRNVHSLVPKCLGAEVFWYPSVLGPKCPVTLLCSYSQLDKHVCRLDALVINDDRRCRSGRYQRWFGRTASLASKAFSESHPHRLRRPRHLMYLVLPFPRNESSRNFRFRDLLFLQTFVPGERKFRGPFVPGNFRFHICVRRFITAGWA